MGASPSVLSVSSVVIPQKGLGKGCGTQHLTHLYLWRWDTQVANGGRL